MGSEKSDEDIELPQTTERVIPLDSERAKMLSLGPDAVAQPVAVPKEKGLPRVLLISADEMEPLNLNNDIEEIKQKVWFKPNLKASSNVIFVQHHWRKYSHVQRGVGKPTRKLPFIQRFGAMIRRSTMRKKVRPKSKMSDIDSPKLQNSVFKRLAKPKMTIHGDLCGVGPNNTSQYGGNSMDSTGLDILSKLVRLGQRKQ
ncbi:UNVERIFIED_CONTAM: Splicing factor 3B subunit 2, partial [Trichonephila clavipes]